MRIDSNTWQPRGGSDASAAKLVVWGYVVERGQHEGPLTHERMRDPQPRSPHTPLAEGQNIDVYRPGAPTPARPAPGLGFNPFALDQQPHRRQRRLEGHDSVEVGAAAGAEGRGLVDARARAHVGARQAAERAEGGAQM